MKKLFLSFIALSLLIVIIHYFSYDYDISYYIGDYEINEKYDSRNKIMSFNIKDSEKYYYFEIDSSRFMRKKLILSINEIEENNNKCILPISKKVHTYLLCYDKEEFINNIFLDSYEDTTINQESFKYLNLYYSP